MVPIAAHILLIEHRANDAGLIRAALEQDPALAFTLEAAESLEAGLARLASQKFDLALLDLDNPGAQDLEALAQIHQQAADLPLVACFNPVDPLQALQILQAGAQDTLEKTPSALAQAGRILRYACERHTLTRQLAESEARLAAFFQTSPAPAANEFTQIKTAETALQDATSRYYTLFKQSHDAVFILDLQGRHVEVNQRAAEMTGYSQEEIIGLSVRELSAEVADSLNIRDRLLAGEHIPPYERRFRKKNGEIFPVEINVEIVRDASGKPLHIQSIVRDISRRKQAEQALRHSAALLAEAQRVGRLGHYEWTPPGREMICSDELFVILDIPPRSGRISQEELSSKVCMEERQTLIDRDRQAFASHSDLDYEFCIRLDNGQPRWLHQVARVTYDAAGQPVRILGIIQDITERRLAADALQASEKKYRELIENLDNVVAVVDEQGRFEYMNATAAGWLDGTPQTLTGKHLLEIFPDESGQAQMAAIQQVLREDRGLISEIPSLVQGAPRWFRTSVQPLHDAAGRAVHVLVNATDVHPLKLVQQELESLNHSLEERVRQRTAEVQDLYDRAPIGYHSLDGEGRFVMINQTELDWLGCTTEAVLGRHFTDFTTPAGRTLFQANFPLFKQRGWVKDLELEFVRQDGSVFPVLVSSDAIYDEAGQYLSSRTIVFDNTRRKAAENALRHAVLELDKAMRLKDEFLANISHELRTPLNGILGFAQLLEAGFGGPLSESQQKSVQQIEQNGERLLQLVSDLLDIARIQAGQMEIQPVSLDIAELCQASLTAVAEQARLKNITLICQIHTTLQRLNGDPQRLRQILVSLLNNAIKFSPNHGRVRLQVETDLLQNRVEFAVIDTGIGIAADDLPRLFAPFAQVDGSLSRRYEGVGLGLALVKRLVELHGGSVSVSSEPGQGSQFTISLPWLMEAAAPSGSQFGPSPLPGTQGAILLAENNDANLMMFSIFLENYGYQVNTARDGLQALTLADQSPPDLILLDIQMPRLDGLEATRRLRADPRFRDTPIVLVTALAMPGDRERCLAAGADEYLSKPVSLKTLVELVRNLLDKN